MTDKNLIGHEGGWNWQQPLPFSLAVSAGDLVYVSGQHSLDNLGGVMNPGDIAAQTRNVFEHMKAALAKVDLELSDLVRLNTYYVFDGDDKEATRYWEDMTRVRLEYFPDPGPAATAVRIKGMPYAGQLIQIEGIALKGEARRTRERIMPDGSWDWSIAVPLSQGWRVGDRIFVGGQISADEKGGTVDAGNVHAQTRNIYGFIRRVMEDAGGTMDDIVHVKVCFKHEDGDDLNVGLSQIFNVTKEVFASPGPGLTAFGVDLLYPGLVLEIDAMAVIGKAQNAIATRPSGGTYQPVFCEAGWSIGDEIYTGGLVALADDGSVIAPDNVTEQAKIVFERMRDLLASVDARLEDIVKLNIFIVGEPDAPDVAEAFHLVAEMWAAVTRDARPAMTPVRVHELPVPGLVVQADAIAIR